VRLVAGEHDALEVVGGERDELGRIDVANLNVQNARGERRVSG
jgi:hypothetical protein